MKSITQKLIGSEEERAVSPVIGVILMVAITVILAAVIAAFVLDIGPGDTDPQAAISVEGDQVELQSIDQGDGIAVVNQSDSDFEDIGSNNIATVSGETANIGDDDDTIFAFSGESDGFDELNDVESFSDLEDEGFVVTILEDDL